MSIEIQAVESLRVFSESTFGADATASLASFTYVPFNEGSCTMALKTDELDPMQAVQRRTQGREKVLGKRSATLQFTMPLAPTGTAAGASTVAVQGALGLLLKAVMGGETLGTGSTFGVGSSATVLVLASTAGHLAGGLVGWTNAAGIVEWREIEVVTNGTTMTVKHGFSGSPANGNVAYAAATYYFTEDPTESLQFLVAGAESDDRWLLLGGQCTGGITINIDPSGSAIPTIAFSFTFCWYLESDETAASVTGTLPTASYTNYNPIVGNAGELRMYTVGSATHDATSLVHCSAFSFQPKVTFIPVTSPSGANGGGILRWRGARANPPVQGSITTYFDGLGWFQARDAKTDKDVIYVDGTAAGSAVILSAPTVQILNPNRADAAGIAGQTFSYEGRDDTDVGSSVTAQALSGARIHLG